MSNTTRMSGVNRQEWAQAAESAKEAAASAGESAQQAVSSIGAMASQAASDVGTRADELTASAARASKGWATGLARSRRKRGC